MRKRKRLGLSTLKHQTQGKSPVNWGGEGGILGEVLSTLAGSVGGQGLQLVAREGCMGMMMMGVEWEEWLGETFFFSFFF